MGRFDSFVTAVRQLADSADVFDPGQAKRLFPGGGLVRGARNPAQSVRLGRGVPPGFPAFGKLPEKARPLMMLVGSCAACQTPLPVQGEDLVFQPVAPVLLAAQTEGKQSVRCAGPFSTGRRAVSAPGGRSVNRLWMRRDGPGFDPPGRGLTFGQRSIIVN